MGKPSAILLADVHLREDTPRCRTDNFFEALTKKIQFIGDYQKANGNIPILIAGDVFDKWKSNPSLLTYAISNLNNVVAIVGQHDLPNHSASLYHKSSVATLEAAGVVTVLGTTDASSKIEFDGFTVTGFPWGAPFESYKPTISEKTGLTDDKRHVALAHVLTYSGEALWEGMVAEEAKDLMQKLGGYDLILVGDNHKRFVVKEDDQILVNPGSLMRTTADQIEYKPVMHVWYASDNRVEAIPLPIEDDVISREHIEIAQSRDKRMDAFVERLTTKYNIGISFESNLKEHMNVNEVEKEVQELVWASMEE